MTVTTANSLRENSIVNEIFLPCKEVFVINPLKPRKKIRALILLDTRGQQSYISETLRENLQPVAREQQTITVSNNGKYDDKADVANEIYAVERISIFKNGRYNKMAKPDILTGSDYYFSLMRSGIKDARKDSGEHVTDSRNLTEQDLSQFWALEAIGIADPIDFIDDEEAYEQFEKSVRRNEEGRYAILYLGKSNFGLIFGRLTSIWNKLLKDTSLRHQYNQIFKEQLDDKIIEPAPSETPFLRIIFHIFLGSRKGYSLNDQLYKALLLLHTWLELFILMA
ncbi:unnamed protein product [Dracunculus medinensis]|uniref:DUF1758 domain-containing protein n=1 Tax=Dracunculus medinensis TaxID=318479 RepID=A0A0N4UM02_DRAME|nr:unnamed protein product [Dracunculus medinensis]